MRRRTQALAGLAVAAATATAVLSGCSGGGGRRAEVGSDHPDVAALGLDLGRQDDRGRRCGWGLIGARTIGEHVGAREGGVV